MQTVNRSLVHFVRHQRKRGLSDASIITSLVKAGWDPHDVHVALADEATHVHKFAVDAHVKTYVRRCLERHDPHSKIIEELAHHGWSVSAIKSVLLEIENEHDYTSVLDDAAKHRFLRKHTPHFFTRAKKKNAHVKSVLLEKSHGDTIQGGAHKKEESAEQRTQRLENLTAREKKLLDQERINREQLLAMKLDKISQALEKQPPAAPSAKHTQKVSKQAASASTPVSQQSSDGQSQPIIYVKNNDMPNLDALESRFASLANSNPNYMAYTNPIIPEKLHLVDAPSDDRVQTGIPGFDPVVEGGLRRETSTLVAGGPGTGKSTFCLQYLVNGVQHYEEPGVYITFEESKQSIRELGLQFGWDLDRLEKNNKLIVKEYTPEQIDKILESGGGSLRDMIDAIGAKRVVIDSITAFMLLYEGETAQRRASLRLFSSLAKWGCTTMAIAEEQGNVGKHEASVLEYETAAVILLYNERKGDLRQRSLEIFKMRGTKHAGRIFPMRITEQGIEVYPRENFT